ncbi:MLP-like protein 28 [Quillaja saponaria]|uniref:MLP-like protein 28 n=1 Tax=Quillaja saponaria TaxID=32244 RepID=A0AAD7KQD1_QUISA|nr:MLP-like protein 28 [Quillaja saponaria]
MALQGKVETEVEIKVPDDKFYNIWSKQAHHVPTASPNNIEAVHVHDGDWETEGSIKVWKYNIDGSPKVVKEKVVLNDEDKSVTIDWIGRRFVSGIQSNEDCPSC